MFIDSMLPAFQPKGIRTHRHRQLHSQILAGCPQSVTSQNPHRIGRRLVLATLILQQARVSVWSRKYAEMLLMRQPSTVRLMTMMVKHGTDVRSLCFACDALAKHRRRPVLGGSWVVISHLSRVIRPQIWLISIVALLITPLIAPSGDAVFPSSTLPHLTGGGALGVQSTDM